MESGITVFQPKASPISDLPDLKKTEIYGDGELFDMRTGKVEDYSRVLHMQDGYVERKLTWTSPKGKKLQLVMKRFVSLVHKNRMYQQIQITPVNFSGEVLHLFPSEWRCGESYQKDQSSDRLRSFW